PALRSSHRQHARHRGLSPAPGMAGGAGALFAQFHRRHQCRTGSTQRPRHAAGRAAGAGAGPAPRQQGFRRAAHRARSGTAPSSLAGWRGRIACDAGAAGRSTWHRRARPLPRLARRYPGAAGRRRLPRLPVTPRAAGQCRDRGLGRRGAGDRDRERRAKCADRRRRERLAGAGRRCRCASPRDAARHRRPGIARAPRGRRARGACGRVQRAARRRPLSRLLRPSCALMCGIAGIMTVNGAAPPAAALQAMGAALKHRGPDGNGHYKVGEVGMVQTRLAIIDLATGDQPLHERGGAALIANGEIYNYIELRAALSGSGVGFSTGSDCETPLHLYRRHGLAFTDHLRGMYAIALHDPVAGRLVVARDPFGIKPLYYAETSHGFVFASEPEALVASGLVQALLVRQVRNELLQLQFTTGRETIFAGIQRVLPGETVVVMKGRVVERRRREALPSGAPLPRDDEAALTAFDRVFADSVLVHQRADVPYGMFLSGGLDSSAVLAMMARLNERPVKAFTVGFGSGQVADEREQARAVAKALGAEHVEVEFREGDFWRLLPEVARAMDDPAADYAVLPTYKLAATARAAGLKVILSGEGGDELFGGYGRYRSVMRPWWLGGRLLRARGALEKLGVLRGDLAGWRDGIAAAELRSA